MSELSITLSRELSAAVVERAGKAPGGEAAWVAEAVRERLSAIEAVAELHRRAARGSAEAFDRILAEVPALPPQPGDELP